MPAHRQLGGALPLGADEAERDDVPVIAEERPEKATKAWVLFWTSALLFAVWLADVGISASSDQRGDWGSGGWLTAVLFALAMTSFSIAGIAIARHRPHNTIAWLLLWNGFVWAASGAVDLYANYGLFTHPGSLPLALWVAAGTQWVWVPAIGICATYLLLLFPDGHLPSPRWRWFAWAIAILMVVISVVITLIPGSLESVGYPGYDNPFGVESLASILEAAQILLLLFPIAIIACVVSLFQRYRRSSGIERLQLKWLVSAAAVIAAVYVVAMVASLFVSQGTAWLQFLQDLAIFSLVLIPIAIGFAILRYHLFEIDALISKAVVYAGLAAFITLVYVGLVVGLGRLIGAGSGNAALSLIATAVVAIAFQPVRTRMQRVANRLVYGDRSTPYEVLSGLSTRLSEAFALDDLLPRIARGLSEATGGRAVVWVRSESTLRPDAVWPSAPEPPEPIQLAEDAVPNGMAPVRHQGELLGALSVDKPPGETLSPTEQDLLDELAGQAGLVLRNVTLTEDLRATIEELRESRRRIVAAQDERAKKLERDLHDGAQQQLVALAVKLRLATGFVESDPSRATSSLRELQGEAQDALENLRALAQGIYPPLLADQGLGAALEAQARRAAVPTTVHVDGTGRYAPEVEAAVYFCTLEALNNVAKYANASAAQIQLEPNGSTLTFRITDDGSGFDPASVPRGSGLQGMVDRLEAVGGSFSLASTPGGGTTVTGTVPVDSAAAP